MPTRTLACLLFASASAFAQADNILIIIADDLGTEILECYGQAPNQPETTNIDQLASAGMRFTNVQACSNCSPTRASLLTGRYQQRHMVGSYISGMDTRVTGLRGEEVTFPELLPANYSDALIGKWHVSPQSQADASTWDAPRAIGHFGHFAGDITRPQSYCDWRPVTNGSLGQANSAVYKTWQETQNAIDWIGAQNGPWVCVLAYHAPHAPFHMPPPHTGATPPPPVPVCGQNPATPTAPDRDCYEAMVEYMDKEIGRLLGAITESETNVIFLSDNGTPRQVAAAGGVDTWRAKGTPYEGGVKVPFIVRGPIVDPDNIGTTESALAHVTDLFSTVLDLAGAVAPVGVEVDGTSLVPYFENETPTEPRQFAYSTLFEYDAWPAPIQTIPAERISQGIINTSDQRYWSHFCIRDQQFKLMRIAEIIAGKLDVRLKFYDLINDPDEQFPLIDADDSQSAFGSANAPAVLLGHQVQAFDALNAELLRLHPVPSTPAIFEYGKRECVVPLGDGPMRIGHAGVPAVGSTFDVTLSKGPSAAPVILLANLDATYGRLNLNLCSSCFEYLLIGVPITGYPGITSTSGSLTVPVTVPTEALGLTFYMQWQGTVACSGFSYEYRSDALAVTVGPSGVPAL